MLGGEMNAETKRVGSLVACLGMLVSTSGCVTLGMAAATEGAVVVAQERTVGRAVDDTSILAQIKHFYLQKDVNDLFPNVEVKVVEGVVLLTGNVDKIDTQIEAVRLAWQADGVREVINEIQISDKSGLMNYAQDVWISTQVRTRLLLSKDIKSINYSVITVNQTVYLMGIAQDSSEMDRAMRVASTTSYVKQVVNHVRLKDDPRRTLPSI